MQGPILIHISDLTAITILFIEELEEAYKTWYPLDYLQRVKGYYFERARTILDKEYAPFIKLHEHQQKISKRSCAHMSEEELEIADAYKNKK
jgi:hypothetical protein